MPGGVPRTSTLALTNSTLPYALVLAQKGWKQACLMDSALKAGVNMVQGQITCQGVADAFGMECRDINDLLMDSAQV